jgi:hypothetical protein
MQATTFTNSQAERTVDGSVLLINTSPQGSLTT